MAANYSSVNPTTPYGSGDPYYNESTGYITPQASAAKKTSNWIKYGIPVAIVAIVGIVVGVVLGTRSSHNSSSSGASSSAAATSAIGAKNALGIFPTGTDSLYMLPLYPSTVSARWPFLFVFLTILHRPTLLPSRHPPLPPPPTPTLPGPMTPSNLLLPAQPKFAQTGLVLSLLLTSGQSSPS